MTTAAPVEQTQTANNDDSMDSLLGILDKAQPPIDPVVAPNATVEPKVEEVVEQKVEETPKVEETEKKSKFNPLLEEPSKKEDASKVDDTDEIPKSAKEVGRAFKQAREKQREAQRNTEVLQKQLEEAASKLKALEPAAKEAQELREKLSKMEAETERTNLVKSRNFLEKYGQPAEKLEKRIESIAKTNNMNVWELKEAMSVEDPSERRKKLKELAIGLDPTDQYQLLIDVDAHAEIQKEAKTVLERAKEANDLLRREQDRMQSELRKQRDAQIDKTFEDVFSEAQKNLPILREVDGEDEHNKFVQGVKQALKGMDNDASLASDDRRRALMFLQALVFPGFYEKAMSTIKELATERDALKNKVEKVQHAQPRVGTSTEPRTAAKPSTQSTNESISDMLSTIIKD